MIRFSTALTLLALSAGAATAATFTVTNANDAGAGSLRAAVAAANGSAGDDDIVFDPSLAGQTIVLLTTDAGGSALFGNSALYVSEAAAALTIDGAAAPGLRISGDFSKRHFAVETNSTLTLQNLTLIDGRIDGRIGGAGDGGGGGSAGMGGAVFVDTGGTLTVLACTIQNCTARGGNGGAGTGVGGGGGGGGLAAVGAANAGVVGGAGGGPNGGAAGSPGGAGGVGGGGGGGNQTANPVAAVGGVGGFAGGGGGSGGVTGGPGTAGAAGGTGGFGGGGGGRGLTAALPGAAGAAGFGGGTGGIDGATAANRGGGGAGAGMGGAIFNNAATVNLINSTFVGNFALGGNGGAGSATPLGDGSSGTGLGGAVFLLNGTTRIVGCTLGGNTGSQGGAAVYIRGDFGGTATVFFENSIAADRVGSPNEVMATASMVSMVTATGMGNVIELSVGVPALGATAADPALQALANNGGPTQTQSLGAGSSALGIGVGATCAAAVPTGSGGLDQRGATRVTCDAGAFENGTGSIVVLGGDSQSALINSAFATPLRVRVLNGLGAPVAGVNVTFTSPGAGAGATFSSNPVVTDGMGEAQVTATANGTAGSYTVFASVPTGANANFGLTNTTNSLTVIGGDNQQAPASGLFTEELAVRLLNSSGAPIAGQAITFTAPGAGPSGFFSQSVVVTDAQGEARTRIVANTTPGGFVATASALGVSANFTLTIIADGGGGGFLPIRRQYVIKGDDCSLSPVEPGPWSGLIVGGLLLALLTLRRRT